MRKSLQHRRLRRQSRFPRILGLALCAACLQLAVALEVRPQIGSTQGLVKKKLPSTVNSAARELCPTVSADGRTLYFTREVKDVEHQTIWCSERLSDGTWGPAVKMPSPLNNDTTTFLSAALPDNNTLLVGGSFGSVASRASANDYLSGAAGGGQPAGPQKSMTIEESMRLAKKLEEADKDAKKRGTPLTFEELKRIFDEATPGTASQQPQAPDSAGEYNPNHIIAMTHRTGSGWSVPEYLRIKNFVNLAQRNDFFACPDDKVFILSVEAAPTFGKRDLYVSFQRTDGGWNEPKNMGNVLNSGGNEISPFVAPDGKTLFFGSDREGGYGGFDIYMTRRLDDTWLNWSAPKNLGPEINSELDEANLTVDASGKYAYMSLGKRYQEDLYEFALPAEVRPTPVAFVRGMCKNPSGNPVAATVAYERLRDGSGAGSANAHPTTGHYQIALPIGEDYAFRAQAANHIPVSERLDLRQAKESQTIDRDLILVPIQVGASIRLNNIFFESGKAGLLPESKMELDRLIGLLNARKTMVIQVSGHTDSEGADEMNMRLSEERAASVRTYLAEHGIAAERLSSKGYGKTKPVASNETAEGRQLNRRVEFTIVKE